MKVKGKILKISSNKRNRTFTIYVQYNGKTEWKYRTLPFSKQEFAGAVCFWAQNDWNQFLKTDEYYKV